MVSSGHLYILRLPGADEGRRSAVMARLAERGVSTNVHYKPLPLLTAYRRLGWAIEDFPHAWDYYRGAITLPLHTRLSDDDVDYVCACLREAVAP
jgi:dTDP-4-amino-4,6-dideoxygalactose transaminase